jgi:hypothetical protein
MRASNVFAGVVILIWIAWLWVGLELTRGVVAQHVTGYPDQGQISFYVGVPAALIVILFLACAIFNFLKRSSVGLALVSALALIVVLPFTLFYGGGV